VAWDSLVIARSAATKQCSLHACRWIRPARNDVEGLAEASKFVIASSSLRGALATKQIQGLVLRAAWIAELDGEPRIMQGTPPRITAPDFRLSERNCTGRAAYLAGTRVVVAALL
jgi:hypothetical protein